MRFSIYEENMDRLEKKMTRIQNKCRKYGCDFRFEKVGEEYKEIKDKGIKRVARFVIVEAEGIAKANGWQLVAAVQHTEKGNIIRQVGDVEVPECYYTGKPVCDHCGTNRARKDTYILVNEDGEFKQVGKSCLKDFTSGMSAEFAAEYISLYDSLIEGSIPAEGADKWYVETEVFLEYAAECVLCFGYTKSGSEGISTWQRAEDYYCQKHGFLHSAKVRDEMEESGFNPENSAESVKKALEWLDRKTESSEYIHNLKVACSLEYSEPRNFGILASLFQAYENDNDMSSSEFIGEIGKRIHVKIKNSRCVTSWRTEYGTTRIFRMEDENGNVLTWKTSNDVPEAVKEIIGTVKNHKEFRGEKQTELTRCRIAA